MSSTLQEPEDLERDILGTRALSMCNIKGQQPHLVKGENALILHHFKTRTEVLF